MSSDPVQRDKENTEWCAGHAGSCGNYEAADSFNGSEEGDSSKGTDLTSRDHRTICGVVRAEITTVTNPPLFLWLSEGTLSSDNNT
jgi:hypothetical protein